MHFEIFKNLVIWFNRSITLNINKPQTKLCVFLVFGNTHDNNMRIGHQRHDRLSHHGDIFESEDQQHCGHDFNNGSQRHRRSLRPSHLYGHPLFRASQGDLTAREPTSSIHQHIFSSQRDLSRRQSDRFMTRSDPTNSSRRRMTDGNRSKEILATISPRRIPSCKRCLPVGK